MTHYQTGPKISTIFITSPIVFSLILNSKKVVNNDGFPVEESAANNLGLICLFLVEELEKKI